MAGAGAGGAPESRRGASMNKAEQLGREVDRWLEEPLYWARTFGGPEFDPWSGQEELWRQYGLLLNAKLKRYQGGVLTDDEAAIVNKMGISVMAGQGLGKERSVALMGLHYAYVLKGYQPKGVCTAPAGPTLHSTLWPEFGKVIAGSPALQEVFEKQSDRIFLKEDKRRGEFARIEPRTIQQNSHPDAQGTVLAGIHAIGVLYLVTEASEVPAAVWRPLEGGLTDPLSMIIMIFNPTRRSGFAYESQEKHRRDWVCLQWSGRTLKAEQFEHPGRFTWFNAQAQDVLIRKFGEDSDFVRIRVDGLPPKGSADTLIGYEDVMAATERQIHPLPGDPLVKAIDVGGEDGGDPSVIATMRGPVLVQLQTFSDKNTVQLGDHVAGALKNDLMALDEQVQVQIGVDTIGIGRGVYYHLTDVQRLTHVHMIDVSELPLDRGRFHRLRDQIWWELREALVETRTLVLALTNARGERIIDEELIGELTSLKWAEVGGKIKVQGKGSSSGLPGVPPLTRSPGKAEALGMAWWLYRHFCSTVPVHLRRRQRLVRQRVVSWKAR